MFKELISSLYLLLNQEDPQIFRDGITGSKKNLERLTESMSDLMTWELATPGPFWNIFIQDDKVRAQMERKFSLIQEVVGVNSPASRHIHRGLIECFRNEYLGVIEVDRDVYLQLLDRVHTLTKRRFADISAKLCDGPESSDEAFLILTQAHSSLFILSNHIHGAKNGCIAPLYNVDYQIIRDRLFVLERKYKETENVAQK